MLSTERLISIHDYSNSVTIIRLVPDGIKLESEAIVDWLMSEGYNGDETEWMLCTGGFQVTVE